MTTEPKKLRVPGAADHGYSLDKATKRTPPIFKWNCPADVAIVAERLKQCTVHPDNIAGDVDGLGRDYGLHPNKIFLLLRQTFPILANNAGVARQAMSEAKEKDLFANRFGN